MQNRRKRRNHQRRGLLMLAGLLSIVLIVVLIIAVGMDTSADDDLGPSDSSGKLQMSLQGSQSVTLEYTEQYKEPGVKVLYDGEEVDAQITVDAPKMEKLGEYQIRYAATYRGKTVQIMRIVKVVDTTPPEITLQTIPGYVPEMGSEYREEGYTATDHYDGDITDRVIVTREGDIFRYTVSDSSGNSVTAERKVVWHDSIAPVITLKGDQTLTVKVGTSYAEPGYEATDAVDGDLTANVTVSGSFDPYIPGTYIYTYTVTDASGNTAAVERKIVVEPMKQPDTVQPEGKVIYLTFDDGPSQYTPELLKILKKYNIKATFFVVGNARLEYLDDIVNEGHTIAIHTNTHEYSDIYSSIDAYLKDLNAIKQKIYDRTGVECTLVRFPGGTGNSTSKKYCPGIMTRLAQLLPTLGYQYCDWNVDSRDAVDATTAEKVYQNVINGIKGKDVAYVLQHDIKDYSVDAVEKIIQWGLANGYTFLPLDKNSPMCHQNPNN